MQERVFDIRHHKYVRGPGWLGLSVLLFMLFFAGGCGRYGSPLAPERFAPAPVEALALTAEADRVKLEWDAPLSDASNAELRSMDGYAVYRLTRESFAGPLATIDPDDYQYEKIGFVEDDHVVKRDALRKEARARGEVGRGLDVPAEEKHFMYEDTDVQSGKIYFYSVVPMNQGWVEGAEKLIARVLFKGAESSVLVLKAGEARYIRQAR